MTKSEQEKVEWFKSACGFITWCMDTEQTPLFVLENLEHDIIGLQREERCFAPRLGGYAKFWKG